MLRGAPGMPQERRKQCLVSMSCYCLRDLTFQLYLKKSDRTNSPFLTNAVWTFLFSAVPSQNKPNPIWPIYCFGTILNTSLISFYFQFLVYPNRPFLESIEFKPKLPIK